MTPMFIPLKSEFFEAFCNGTKDTEYRIHGPRWNANTCTVGRPVVISKGYGKQHRRIGVIVGFEVSKEPMKTEAWHKCYGERGEMAACIKIKLDEVNK